MGANVDHYQEMTHKEKIKLVQRNISKVLKDGPRREVDDIVTGIISGNKGNIDGILLDWTTFDKRTRTDQNKGTSNEQLCPERMKTIKVRFKVGGWIKPAEDVAHEYLTDVEQSIRETGSSL